MNPTIACLSYISILSAGSVPSVKCDSMQEFQYAVNSRDYICMLGKILSKGTNGF